MSKPRRKTKAQRESEERAQLLQRIEDIMEGAGCDISRYDDGRQPICVTVVTDYWKVLRAVKTRLAIDGNQEENLERTWNAEHFANQDTLTAWLYDMGVRA